MTKVIFVFVFIMLAGPAQAEDLTYCEKGQKAFLSKNFEQALANYNGCILFGELSPPSRADALRNRGWVHFFGRQTQLAIKDFDEAIELDPDSADGFSGRGTLYLIENQFDRSIQDFNEAIRLDPENADALQNRGHAYIALFEYDRAIEAHSEVIRLKPNHPGAFLNRGSAYLFSGQIDTAIRDYDEAIRLVPDYATAFKNRGIAYSRMGEHNRAIEDLDEALRLEPDNADVFEGRGLAKFYLGHFTAAIPDLKRAARVYPVKVSRIIWLYLAQARAGQDGLGDLRQNTQNLNLDDWPGPIVSMYLGTLSATAIAEMGGASTTLPERWKRCEAMFYIGQYHLLNDEERTAADFFRAAVATDVQIFDEYVGAKAELERLEQ